MTTTQLAFECTNPIQEAVLKQIHNGKLPLVLNLWPNRENSLDYKL